MKVRYRVALDTSERVQLVPMVVGGKAAVRKLKRAQTPTASAPRAATSLSTATATRSVARSVASAGRGADDPARDRAAAAAASAPTLCVACRLRHERPSQFLRIFLPSR
jgi:hypothetical protein